MPPASHPLVTPLGPRFIHGAVEVEKTDAGLLPHWLPAWARARARDPQLALAKAQGSGVRLAFQTASRWLELVVRATRPAAGSDGVWRCGMNCIRMVPAIGSSASGLPGWCWHRATRRGVSRSYAGSSAGRGPPILAAATGLYFI